MSFGDDTRSASGLCGVAIDVFEGELLIVVAAARGCDAESTFSQALPSSKSLARVLLPDGIDPLWVDIDDSSCRFGIKAYFVNQRPSKGIILPTQIKVAIYIYYISPSS